MVSYDDKINWQEFYSSRLQKVKISNDELMALCPFHKDRDPSFNANIKTGLWQCHGCGLKGNGQTFLQKLDGISAKEALAKLNDLAGIILEPAARSKQGAKQAAKPGAKSAKRKYTVEDYAAAKKLPVDFLRKLGLQNSKTGITIPYMDESGARISSRQRYGDTGSGPRFTWTRGSKVNLYGLWKLAQVREAGYVVLVEGESDSHTLWYHGLPALGVPGASVFQQVWVDLIRGLDIYIYKEPDVSGETFVRKISEALYKQNFEGEVKVIHLIDSKDPSELHCKNPAAFKEHWKAAVEMAEALDIQKAAGLIEDVMPDAPVQLRQAPDWRFSEDGIFMVDDKTGLPTCICKTPILLSRRLHAVETGQEKIEIYFRRDKKWRPLIVNRSTLFQARSIPQLADMGLTITSENAKLIVRILQALEAENIDLLERADSVSQLGWHGKQFVPGVNNNLVIDVDPSTSNWLDAYHEEGTLDDWRKLVAPCRSNFIFRFILAASFTAPLLRLTGHRIFIVHNWGETRSGKTAALKAALSVWGDPEGLMASFYATRVGLERLAGFFRDLPLGIDEKQVSSGSSDFSDNLMYMLTLGYGKVRGAKSGGLQASQAWRTIILTTGEEPLSSITSHSGVHTRTLELHGAPFERETDAQKFHELASYGHAGPEFIRRVVGHTGASIKELQAQFAAMLKGVYGDDRLSSHISAVAIVAAADSYVSEWLFNTEQGQAFDDALDMALKIAEVLEDSKEADVIERAHEFISGWVLSNGEQFTDEARAPRFGFVDEIYSDRYYIFPQVLRHALEREGFSYRQVMRGFRDKGLIRTDIDTKRFTITQRFEGKPAKFVGFVLSGLDDISENNGAVDPY